MGNDEVCYVSQMTGITVEELTLYEPGMFYWLLEACLEQDLEDGLTCNDDEEIIECLS